MQNITKIETTTNENPLEFENAFDFANVLSVMNFSNVDRFLNIFSALISES
jgi:hypothetical protein